MNDMLDYHHSLLCNHPPRDVSGLHFHVMGHAGIPFSEARNRAGITIEQLSESTGLSVSILEQMETHGYASTPCEGGLSSVPAAHHYFNLPIPEEIRKSAKLMIPYKVPRRVWPKRIRGHALHHGHGMSAHYYQRKTRHLYPCQFVRLTKSGLIMIRTTGRIDRIWEEHALNFNHREGDMFRHTVDGVVWREGLDAIIELQGWE